jgi:hypothetical protein
VLVSTALTMVRKQIYDVNSLEYTDEELINYLNSAISLLGYELIKADAPDITAEITISVVDTAKPTGFVQWAARYPLTVSGGLINAYGTLPITARYYKHPALVAATTDNLPFDNDIYNHLLVQLTAIMALNRNEYEISQDSALAGEIKKAITETLAIVR